MTPGYPNAMIGVDIIGTLPGKLLNHRYILVLMDYFTKWC